MHILRSEPALYGALQGSEQTEFQKCFAPVVICFCEWILKQAERDRVDRIYFVARDTWLSYITMQTLCRMRSLPLEIRYLRMSRQTLLEAVEDLNAEERLRGYLEIEGVHDGTPYAIVDSGWVGTTRAVLEQFLGSAFLGYYFGLYELPPGVNRKACRFFLFGPTNHLYRKAHFSNSLLEVVLSEPTGRCIGYRGEEQRYAPMLDGREYPNAEASERYRKDLEDYLFWYLLEACKVRHPQWISARLLRALMAHPTKTEVREFGDLQFSDRTDEGGMTCVATQWSRKDVKQQAFLRKVLIKTGGLIGELSPESAWPEGSAIRNGYFPELTLWRIRLYKYLMYARKGWEQRKLTKNDEKNPR